MKLLVIDDEEDIREVASLTLELKEGWEVAAAGSGAEGIKLARGSVPDAILLDAPQQEVIVASAGLAGAIIAELLRGRAGVAGLRLQTVDAFARRLLNDAGEYPRVASDAERRLAMRMAVRTVDDPMMETRGI